MKSLFCILLAVSSFGGNLLGQSNTTISHSFPALATDTVDSLPTNQKSNRLERLLREASDSAKTPIRFTKLPKEFPNTSLATNADGEKIVALREGMDQELEENAIAHELFHIILQGQGFAFAVHTPEPTAGLLQDLGFTITSCVDDAVIDRRMQKLGFKPQVLNHDTAERLRVAPPSFAPSAFDDPVLKDGNALLIVCYSFRLRNPTDQIEQTWLSISPKVVERAHELKTQIGDISCDRAETCLEKKKLIRNALGYPITFLDPVTRSYE